MHVRIALALLFTIGITVACGDDNPAPTGPTQVTPPEATRTLNTLRITTSDAEFMDGGQVLSVGETVDLMACAIYSDDTEDCTITATWESLDSSIATIDNGTVTGVAPGEVQIRASYETASVTTRITVEAPPVVAERLVVTGPADFLDNRELEVGQTVQLRADLEMSDDSVRENVEAEWSSSNTIVATIDSSGLVTARQAGGFDIHATAEGLTARLTGLSAVSPPQPNRSPTVTASCNPCTVEVDSEVRLQANASDPDGDQLSYSWSAPRGRLIGSTSEATARWRAPDQEGSVQITVRVTDGRGGSASRSVTVRVNRPAPDHPPVREFRNCTELRGAGWNRGVNRNGGTYRSSWDDAERRTYNLNTKSDRNNDGHACET